MKTLFPILAAALLLAGCSSSSKLTPLVGAADPTPAIREIAGQIVDEVNGQTEVRTEAVHEQLAQVSGQVGQLQTAVEAAAEQAEFRAREMTPLTTFAPAAKPALAAKLPNLDKVISAVNENGQKTATTLRQVADVAQQVQQIAAQLEQLRAAQQATAADLPSPVAQQAPAGILALITLVLSLILRAKSKNPGGK